VPSIHALRSGNGVENPDCSTLHYPVPQLTTTRCGVANMPLAFKVTVAPTQVPKQAPFGPRRRMSSLASNICMLASVMKVGNRRLKTHYRL
jgi:hypothetical protein